MPHELVEPFISRGYEESGPSDNPPFDYIAIHHHWGPESLSSSHSCSASMPVGVAIAAPSGERFVSLYTITASKASRQIASSTCMLVWSIGSMNCAHGPRMCSL